MPEPIITVLYLVQGSQRTFEVKISPAECVSHLKNVVRRKHWRTFLDVGAGELVLWAVDLSLSEARKKPESGTGAREQGGEEMNAASILSVYYPTQPKCGRVHMIVERPSDAHKSTPSATPSPSTSSITSFSGSSRRSSPVLSSSTLSSNSAGSSSSIPSSSKFLRSSSHRYEGVAPSPSVSLSTSLIQPSLRQSHCAVPSTSASSRTNSPRSSSHQFSNAGPSSLASSSTYRHRSLLSQSDRVFKDYTQDQEAANIGRNISITPATVSLEPAGQGSRLLNRRIHPANDNNYRSREQERKYAEDKKSTKEKWTAKGTAEGRTTGTVKGKEVVRKAYVRKSSAAVRIPLEGIAEATEIDLEALKLTQDALRKFKDRRDGSIDPEPCR